MMLQRKTRTTVFIFNWDVPDDADMYNMHQGPYHSKPVVTGTYQESQPGTITNVKIISSMGCTDYTEAVEGSTAYREAVGNLQPTRKQSGLHGSSRELTAYTEAVGDAQPTGKQSGTYSLHGSSRERTAYLKEKKLKNTDNIAES
ncbi:hypothetical protein STEG23_035854 [Scotinomys teguina]